MKKRKIPTVIGSLFLVVGLLFPTTVQVAEQSGQTIELTMNIPATHEVTLVIGDHGLVQVKEHEYREKQTVAIDRLSEQITKLCSRFYLRAPYFRTTSRMESTHPLSPYRRRVF